MAQIKDVQRQKINGSVSGISNKGFTLIEILIAIALIGLMATVVVPNLGRRRPKAEREAFIAKVDALVQLAWQNALLTGKNQRVVFDFTKERVFLEQATGQKDAKGEQFAPVTRSYLATELKWPKRYQIKNFFIEGFDEMTRFVGKKTGQTWFYAVPDGMTQRVTINLLDTADKGADRRPKKIALVLNPFNARFKVYDTFKT